MLVVVLEVEFRLILIDRPKVEALTCAGRRLTFHRSDEEPYVEKLFVVVIASLTPLAYPASEPPTSSLIAWNRWRELSAAARSISAVTPTMIDPAGMENPKFDTRSSCDVPPFDVMLHVAAVDVVSPVAFDGFDQAVVPPSFELAPVPAYSGPAEVMRGYARSKTPLVEFAATVRVFVSVAVTSAGVLSSRQ